MHIHMGPIPITALNGVFKISADMNQIRSKHQRLHAVH
jgi:hypothetical protein